MRVTQREKLMYRPNTAHVDPTWVHADGASLLKQLFGASEVVVIGVAQEELDAIRAQWHGIGDVDDPTANASSALYVVRRLAHRSGSERAVPVTDAPQKISSGGVVLAAVGVHSNLSESLVTFGVGTATDIIIPDTVEELGRLPGHDFTAMYPGTPLVG